MMTPDQRELVRQSLDRLSEEADPVTLLLYGKLFELDPSARRLFHNDLAAQGRKLMDTLDAVASSLDRFESLRPRLARLGRLHASYGVLPARLRHLDHRSALGVWSGAGRGFRRPHPRGLAPGPCRRCRRHARGCCNTRMIDCAVILRPCWMKGGIGS